MNQFFHFITSFRYDLNFAHLVCNRARHSALISSSWDPDTSKSSMLRASNSLARHNLDHHVSRMPYSNLAPTIRTICISRSITLAIHVYSVATSSHEYARVSRINAFRSPDRRAANALNEPIKPHQHRDQQITVRLGAMYRIRIV